MRGISEINLLSYSLSRFIVDCMWIFWGVCCWGSASIESSIAPPIYLPWPLSYLHFTNFLGGSSARRRYFGCWWSRSCSHLERTGGSICWNIGWISIPAQSARSHLPGLIRSSHRTSFWWSYTAQLSHFYWRVGSQTRPAMRFPGWGRKSQRQAAGSLVQSWKAVGSWSHFHSGSSPWCLRWFGRSWPSPGGRIVSRYTLRIRRE